MKLFVTAAILLCVSQAVVGSCDFPPRLWCSSGEIAKQCDVYDQCKAAAKRSSDAPPVNVTLYYESLCPDCKRFFQTQLFKTWQTLSSDVMNLTLVPYGNARERKSLDKWEFTCQHGNQECIGNVIETCAINLLKDKSVYVPFIYCMEKSEQDPTKAAEKCAENQKIDLAPIVTCSNGKQGNDMEHDMAVMTDALNPPHKYVPWVTINGVHTEKMEKEAENDLVGLICDTYTGSKPDACGQYFQRLDRKCYNN